MTRISKISAPGRLLEILWHIAGLALCVVALAGCSHTGPSVSVNDYNPALGNGRTAPPNVIAAQARQQRQAAAAAAKVNGK